ncbi:MAG: hypothetical protein AAF310_05360 [Myxococcota bacterium]
MTRQRVKLSCVWLMGTLFLSCSGPVNYTEHLLDVFSENLDASLTQAPQLQAVFGSSDRSFANLSEGSTGLQPAGKRGGSWPGQMIDPSDCEEDIDQLGALCRCTSGASGSLGNYFHAKCPVVFVGEERGFAGSGVSLQCYNSEEDVESGQKPKAAVGAYGQKELKIQFTFDQSPESKRLLQSLGIFVSPRDCSKQAGTTVYIDGREVPCVANEELEKKIDSLPNNLDIHYESSADATGAPKVYAELQELPKKGQFKVLAPWLRRWLQEHEEPETTIVTVQQPQNRDEIRATAKQQESGERVQALEKETIRFQKEKQATLDALQNERNRSNRLQAQLQQANNDLAAAQNSINDERNRANAEQNRADGLQRNLNARTQERDRAQNGLHAARHHAAQQRDQLRLQRIQAQQIMRERARLQRRLQRAQQALADANNALPDDNQLPGFNPARVAQRQQLVAAIEQVRADLAAAEQQREDFQRQAVANGFANARANRQLQQANADLAAARHLANARLFAVNQARNQRDALQQDLQNLVQNVDQHLDGNHNAGDIAHAVQDALAGLRQRLVNANQRNFNQNQQYQQQVAALQQQHKQALAASQAAVVQQQQALQSQLSRFQQLAKKAKEEYEKSIKELREGELARMSQELQLQSELASLRQKLQQEIQQKKEVEQELAQYKQYVNEILQGAKEQKQQILAMQQALKDELDSAKAKWLQERNTLQGKFSKLVAEVNQALPNKSQEFPAKDLPGVVRKIVADLSEEKEKRLGVQKDLTKKEGKLRTLKGAISDEGIAERVASFVGNHRMVNGYNTFDEKGQHSKMNRASRYQMNDKYFMDRDIRQYETGLNQIINIIFKDMKAPVGAPKQHLLMTK